MHQDFDETNLIEQSFELTQKLSRINNKRNFRCPCCQLNRIAKAQTGEKNEWLHTGCCCTYRWLRAHGKLFVTIPERFSGTCRFKG